MLKKRFAMLLQRRRILFLILSFLCASHLSFAQGKITVSGTVASDSSNAPLSNVSIKIKGKAGGTTSDANGVFTIKVDKGSTLVFSIVGYEDKEVRIESEATGLSIRLTAKISNLSDVVVIGYGTQKLKDVTSSISTVSLSDERQRPVVNIMQELAGKAAGVQVQQFNGAPGQDFQVLVRGFTSLSGNANPVYVVDGIVGYNIASLDVNNIASITILKDASATGIYGVAGSANGVVQITTKKGVSGAPRIDVDFSNSYQTVNTEGAQRGAAARLADRRIRQRRARQRYGQHPPPGGLAEHQQQLAGQALPDSAHHQSKRAGIRRGSRRQLCA